LYAFYTCWISLREEHGRRACERRVLRRIFGHMREEVTGGWRKLHNELHNLYYSSNVVRVIKSTEMRLAGHVTCVVKYIPFG
jgi:hypothetical protein